MDLQDENRTSDWPRGAKIETMALVLESKHGSMAGDVAQFFSLFHGQKGNFARQAAWSDVSHHIRKRQMARDASVAGVAQHDEQPGLHLH